MGAHTFPTADLLSLCGVRGVKDTAGLIGRAQVRGYFLHHPGNNTYELIRIDCRLAGSHLPNRLRDGFAARREEAGCCIDVDVRNQ